MEKFIKPCESLKFLSLSLSCMQKNLNFLRMDEARIRTHVIAIQNYENNRIASSCVIFSELISGNTLKIKLHIHMIKNTLFNYYIKHGLDAASSSDKCSKSEMTR